VRERPRLFSCSVLHILCPPHQYGPKATKSNNERGDDDDSPHRFFKCVFPFFFSTFYFSY
jgi:hypothetical protein